MACLAVHSRAVASCFDLSFLYSYTETWKEEVSKVKSWVRGKRGSV